MDITVKAAALLDKCGDVVLSSVSENGFPSPCVLAKIKSEGIHKLWFSTGLKGTITIHFLKNPKAGVCFYSGGDGVTLTGKVTVRTDAATRAALWVDWFINHFPGGVDDPNYCVLEFEAEEATFWIDHEFLTLKGDQLRFPAR